MASTAPQLITAAHMYISKSDDAKRYSMQGMVFDYYVDDATCSMVPWEGKVPSFSYMPDSFASLFVPTVDTTRLTYFLDTLIAKKHYVMFVGNTGEANLNFPAGHFPYYACYCSMMRGKVLFQQNL